GSGRARGCLSLGQLEQASPRRREHVDLEAVTVGGPGAVRNPGRNDGDVALAHCAYVAVQVKGELTLKNDDDLLFLVDVAGCRRARLEGHEVGHGLLAEYRPEPEPGQELHRGHRVHVDVPAGAGRGAARLCGEVAGGIAQRAALAGRRLVYAVAHMSSRAVRSCRAVEITVRSSRRRRSG